MYGLNIDPRNPKGNPQAAELRDLGVETVRYTFKDSSGGSQPDPGRVQFYTQKIEELAQAEIDTLVILTNETYPGKPSFSAPDQEWDGYIARFVERVGQLAGILAPWRPAFQIWNEPDFSPQPGYEPTLRPAVFGRMLSRAHNAVKAVDSGLRVIAAGLSSGQPPWLSEVIQALDNDLPADAVAIHPYTKRPNPDWPDSDWGTGYVGDLITGYRQVIDRSVWITEIGVKRLDSEGQAEYLRRFYRAMAGQFSDIVEQVFWFCYSDNMASPYGLIDVSDNRKPAYFAYGDVTPPRPPPPAGMTVSASHNNQHEGVDNLQQAIDNDPATRWSTQQPQQPGMWFQIDLGEERTISRVRLDNDPSPQDYPRGYIVKVSLDGQSWTTVAENSANDQPLGVTFSPRQARFIRIEQTGSDPIFWWSIHELEISDEGNGESEILTGKGVWALFGNEIDLAIDMARAIGATHILFKTGGGTEYYEAEARASLQKIKAAEFVPFAWPFIFGDDPAGEAEVAVRTWQEGYEGIVFDIEGQAAGKGANIAELGRRLIEEAGLDANHLYFTSFPNISAHATIPYKEMAAFCQGGFMPQSYGTFCRPAYHTLGVMTYQEYENWPSDWGDRPAIYPILGAYYDLHANIRMTPAEFQIWAGELAKHRPTFYSIYRAGVTNEELWPILKELRPFQRGPEQLLKMLQDEFGVWGEGGIFEDIRDILPDKPDRPWFSPTDLDQTTHYVIHHSATDARTSVMDIYDNHLERFGGYGYHFTLYCFPTSGGRHWKKLRYTRTVGLKGAHVLGKNDLATVGVCWVGNYEDNPPAPETVAVVENVLQRLFTTLDRWLGFKPRLAGHRELLERGYTVCPGGNWAFGPGGVLERLSRR